MVGRKKTSKPDFNGVSYPEITRGQNFYALDRNLQSFLQKKAPDLLKRQGKRLEDFGAWVGGDLDEQADFSDKHPPGMMHNDAVGKKKIGRAEFNPLYLKAHQEAYDRGIIGLPFKDGAADPHLLSFVMGYMLSQSDISIHCPVTMTGAVAYVLKHCVSPDIQKKCKPYLDRLSAMDGQTWTGGTWATEKHGGSDVGATTTQAIPVGGDRFELQGFKWFASNAGLNIAIATARPVGAPEGSKGLGLYLVLSELEDGRPNHYIVEDLKDKLGTKALATGEIDLNGAIAIELASPPEGLKLMMEALEYSRIHNAVSGAGVQRRAFMEAMAWSSHRDAFGSKLTDKPMVQQSLLTMLGEVEASTALAFEAAMAFDRALSDPKEKAWLRLSTALAKYHTAEYAVKSSKEAIERVGGNGYTEKMPTARLFRDAMVLPTWEGPKEIQALELLRMVGGKMNGSDLFLNRIDRIIEALPEDEMHFHREVLRFAQQDCADALSHVARNPKDAERVAFQLLRLMSKTLAAALLCEEAAEELKQDGNLRKSYLAGWHLKRNLYPENVSYAQTPAEDHFHDIVCYRAIARNGANPNQKSWKNKLRRIKKIRKPKPDK